MSKSKKPSTTTQRFRKVNPRIWGDAKFLALSADGKILFLYLLTCPEITCLVGVIVLGHGHLCDVLRWTPEQLDAATDELVSAGMVVVDWDARLVWLPKAPVHNRPDNPSVVAGWKLHWQDLPDSCLLEPIHVSLETYASMWGEKYSEAFNLACPAPPPAPHRPPHRPPEGGGGVPPRCPPPCPVGVPQGVKNEGGEDFAGLATSRGDAPKPTDENAAVSGSIQNEGTPSPPPSPPPCGGQVGGEVEVDVDVKVEVAPPLPGIAAGRREPAKVDGKQTRTGASKGEAKPKSEPSPESAAFVAVRDCYFTAYESARGLKPPFGGREGKAIKDLLAKLGDDAERACQCICNAFADPFWSGKATINTIAQEPAKFDGKRVQPVSRPARIDTRQPGIPGRTWETRPAIVQPGIAPLKTLTLEDIGEDEEAMHG